MNDAAEPTHRRRERTRGRGGPTTIQQLPRRQPERRFPPMALLSEDELEAIHLASLRVLEDIGMMGMVAGEERVEVAPEPGARGELDGRAGGGSLLSGHVKLRVRVVPV